MKRGDEIFNYKKENEIDEAVRFAKENTSAAAYAAMVTLENKVAETKQGLQDSANARSRTLDVLKQTGRTAQAALAAASGGELHERLTLAGEERSHGRLSNVIDQRLSDIALSAPTASLETEPHNYVMQERSRKIAAQMVSDIATGKAKPYR